MTSLPSRADGQLQRCFIHATAEIDATASIGEDTYVWNNVQVRERAVIGKFCILGKNVYVDHGVRIGNQVKIQNNVSIFSGVELADNVFVGPHVCFTNDLYPRASASDGSLKGKDDWEVLPTTVEKGASIGAQSTIVAGVTIGEYAMIGAGAVVTRTVPPFALVRGQPARLVGFVCMCGKPIRNLNGICPYCGRQIPAHVIAQFRQFSTRDRAIVTNNAVGG